jgi:hypothetical protein
MNIDYLVNFQGIYILLYIDILLFLALYSIKLYLDFIDFKEIIVK